MKRRGFLKLGLLGAGAAAFPVATSLAVGSKSGAGDGIDVLESIFEYGSTEKIMYASSELVSNLKREATAYGVNIYKLDTPYGTLRTISHPFLKGDEAVVMDMPSPELSIATPDEASKLFPRLLTREQAMSIVAPV